MKKYSLAFMFTLGIISPCRSQLTTGAETVLLNQIYVVHSELRLNGNLMNTSNWYILRGTADTVWMWGGSYGTPEDIEAYRDTFNLTTSFQNDLHLVDSIVDLFGMVHPKPMLIPGHFHLDHCNQETIFGLDSLFGFMQSWVYIHASEHFKCLCNSHCCGTGLCAQGSQYFGAPYHTSWTNPTKTRFRTLGTKNQSCGTNLKVVTTSYGNWIVKRSDSAHTSGSLNMECPMLMIRINGSDIVTTCVPPTGYTVLPIHGNL